MSHPFKTLEDELKEVYDHEMKIFKDNQGGEAYVYLLKFYPSRLFPALDNLPGNHYLLVILLYYDMLTSHSRPSSNKFLTSIQE